MVDVSSIWLSLIHSFDLYHAPDAGLDRDGFFFSLLLIPAGGKLANVSVHKSLIRSGFLFISVSQADAVYYTMLFFSLFLRAAALFIFSFSSATIRLLLAQTYSTKQWNRTCWIGIAIGDDLDLVVAQSFEGPVACIFQ